MSSVQIGHFRASSESPLIAVPITASSFDELLVQVDLAVQAGTDVVEVRLDTLHPDGVPSCELVEQIRNTVRQVYPNLPLIWTYRTVQEGGRGIVTTIDYWHYLRALVEVVKNDQLSVIDCEYRTVNDADASNSFFDSIDEGVISITSFHDWKNVPDNDELTTLFRDMQSTGCSIIKVACFAPSTTEADRFAAWAREVSCQTHQGLIAIVMGEAGVPYRLHPGCAGSLLTFATASLDHQGSAPGQRTVSEVRAVL
ncbi:type I 3-dehydroquinate dehydratase [Actinomyces vulturis]|uniref:type I 3-dehydroquinate dehydratase n=1 Tax=Actinomyces vulturis TaxID=1857645 RepID=UPI000830433C|nr:type I 3-dehydroquinate dehydratase [Actinomyces vulturis]